MLDVFCIHLNGEMRSGLRMSIWIVAHEIQGADETLVVRFIVIDGEVKSIMRISSRAMASTMF